MLGPKAEHMNPHSAATVAPTSKRPLTLRRNLPAEAVRGLFTRSGYLGLRPSCALSPAWLGLDADSVSQDLLYVGRDGQPVGHVSVTRAYGSTWLGHQIAMRRDHAEQIQARSALYQAFASLPTQLDGDEARLLGYFDPTLRWHQRFFTSFADGVSDDLAMVVPWDRFERQAETPLPSDPEFDGVVEPLRSCDLCAASEIARRQLPTLMSDALALTPETLLSPNLHPAYPAAGIGRSRTAFALKQHGRLIAIALCELTDSSLSVFNLMNLAQVFATSEASAPGLLALQNQVRRFYASNDIAYPLLVAPAGRFDGAADPAVHLEETMGCIVWSAQGLRAYRAFLTEQFARLRTA